MRRLVVGLCALLLAAAAQAADPGYALRGDFEQGGLVFGHTDPQATVSFAGRKLLLTEKGEFVFGFDRDAEPDAELRIDIPGRDEIVKHCSVRKRQWKIERVEGLPPNLVNPPPEVEARIESEAVKLKAAHERDTAIDDFAGKFVWPATGRISGVFGSQRIDNGTPKTPHYGVDVAVPVGTPVRAPQGGIVALAEPDLYFTGGTLIIDHGHGLSTIMVHLSKLEVQVGDRLERGQEVALSGMTGRANGPHLHWGMNWFGAHVDAQKLVGAMP
jgi:murein DD-endopeptidase MepM/ murein hydrolase activator NlpD